MPIFIYLLRSCVSKNGFVIFYTRSTINFGMHFAINYIDEYQTA